MVAQVSTTTPTQQNPNGPLSGQQASADGIGAPAPSAPLGSPTTASTIAPAPTPAPSAADYYNQLNQATPSATPTPAPAPSPTPAPSGIIQSAKAQATPAPAPSPVPAPAPATGIINSARSVAPAPAPAPAPSPTPTPAIITNSPSVIFGPGGQTIPISNTPPPAPSPTPATPAPISTLLTQPADYSKPESQAEIDAYNQLAAQAAATGNYSQLDSIGANDERNIFGATFAPGDKSNPAFIAAQMTGKSTAGIPQWLTPQQIAAAYPSAPAPSSGIIASAKNQVVAPGVPTQPTAPVVPNATNSATPTATPAPFVNNPTYAAQINADFEKDFGRPAAAAGEQFYQQALAANPNMTPEQLNAAILAGAQSQDQVAAANLNGNGSLANNWANPALSPANVQSSTTNPNGADTFNTATRQWTTASGVAQGPENANGVQTEASTYNPALLGNPTQVNVNAPQTVAGQLANIDNANSPIIQAARTGALQQANASGLLNSTMAITAGDAAAYNASLPIAEQDATTYNNDAVTNASADNQFAVDNQNAQNSAYQFNAGAQNALTTQKMQQQMSGANTAEDAGKTYASWISTIQNSTMDAGAKNDAEVQAYNTYLQQMQTLAKAGIPDVSGLLQFTGVDPNTGLPDYRDPNTGLYSSTSNAPSATPAATPSPTPTPTPTITTNNPHQ